MDPTAARVSEVGLRLMSGTISPACLRQAQDTMKSNPDSYPWQDIVGIVLADPIDASTLISRGLNTQRDWIAAGGRSPEALAARPPRRSVNVRAKTLLAVVLVKGLFYGFFALVLLFSLNVIKGRWPAWDIYTWLPWLQENVPALFR